MAEFSVNNIIGKTLVATGDVFAYAAYPKNKTKKLIIKGSVVGRVSSWVKDPDNAANVYWQFPEKYGNAFFYVQHNAGKLKLHPEETVESIAEKLAREKEEKEKAEKGVIPYYLERYGKPVLFLAGAALAIKGYSVFYKTKKRSYVSYNK